MLAELATGVVREDVKREGVTHHVFTFHGCLGTQMTQYLRSEIRSQRSEAGWLTKLCQVRLSVSYPLPGPPPKLATLVFRGGRPLAREGVSC